ncbi:MAG: hypothetical protein ACOC7X_02440 [Spirochaetota bacterium]
MGSIRTVALISICASALFLFSYPTAAEQVRSEVQHTATLDAAYSDIRISVGLRELSQIKLEATEFLRGIVIQVNSPRAVLQFRESFLLSVYSNPSPEPRDGVRSYSAEKLLSKPFPSASRTFIDIPFSRESRWEKSTLNSIVISEHIKPEDYPLLLTIDPIMKGIPSDVSRSHFDITVRPVLADKGALELELPDMADQEELELLIDGQVQAKQSGRFTLVTGVHEISVKSDHYLPYTKAIGIEQAQTTRLKVPLEPAESIIRFDAPEDAVVFFDGEKIQVASTPQMEVEPGEHVVLVRIGDYSVSKKIDIEGGKTYKVSLFFDILINDD